MLLKFLIYFLFFMINQKTLTKGKGKQLTTTKPVTTTEEPAKESPSKLKTLWVTLNFYLLL